MFARSASSRAAAIWSTRRAWRNSRARPAAPRCSMSPATNGSVGMRRWSPSAWTSAASLTDQAIDLFDRLVGAMFRKAEGRHARAFQADARAINEKVRLYARVGAALITAHDGKQDAFGAIIAR